MSENPTPRFESIIYEQAMKQVAKNSQKTPALEDLTKMAKKLQKQMK